MVRILSQRAMDLLTQEKVFSSLNSVEKTSQAKKFTFYHWNQRSLWVSVGLDSQIGGKKINELCFYPEKSSEADFLDYQKVLLIAIKKLSKNRDFSFFRHLTFREIEAFLRDTNSRPSLEGGDATDEKQLHEFIEFVVNFPLKNEDSPMGEKYDYPPEKGEFCRLNMTSKIKEMNAFLRSKEVLELYQEGISPKLIDIEDETIFVSVPYQSEREKNRFQVLHELGVKTFRDENLNFIPED